MDLFWKLHIIPALTFILGFFIFIFNINRRDNGLGGLLLMYAGAFIYFFSMLCYACYYPM